MKSFARRIIPKSLYQTMADVKAIYKLRKKISPRRIRYISEVIEALEGRFDRICPICGYEGKFLGKGMPPRIDAWCPSCMSVGKHRLLWLVWTRKQYILQGSKVLHFAPEDCLRNWLRKQTGCYMSADLAQNREVDLILNIEKIDLNDCSYDVVVLNHVLEHVNDRMALEELYRITKPGGKVFVTIPIIEGMKKSYENPGIKSDIGRELHFGQFDHLRVYGFDFRKRATQAGFRLVEYTAQGEEAIKYGLVMGEKVFVLCK